MKALIATLATALIASVATLTATPASASINQNRQHGATAHHKSHIKAADVEVWCGASSSLERERFPYMASIHKVHAANGNSYEVATIFKRGRVVGRQFVFKSQKNNQSIYEASGNTFSLTLNNPSQLNSDADFKAVIQDPQDGDKYIANGTYTCHRSNKS